MLHHPRFSGICAELRRAYSQICFMPSLKSELRSTEEFWKSSWLLDMKQINEGIFPTKHQTFSDQPVHLLVPVTILSKLK